MPPKYRIVTESLAVAMALVVLSACSGNDVGSGDGQGGAPAGGTGSGGTTAMSSGGTAQGGAAQGGAAQGGTAATSGGSGQGGASGGAVAQGGKASGGGTSTSQGGRTAAAGGGSGGAMNSGGRTNGGASNAGASAGGAMSRGGSTASAGGSAGTGSTNCPYTGHVSYTLERAANPSATEQDAYTRITTAMDKALTYYNCYTNITKSIKVSYVPSVSTADGNINGSLRFGSNTTYMDYRTAMHEIGHTVGVGQASNWGSFLKDGLFTGKAANDELTAINSTLTKPLYTELHADTQHFWPYGLNQQSEVKSEDDLLFHCRMVMAIRKDLGLQ